MEFELIPVGCKFTGSDMYNGSDNDGIVFA